MGKKSKWEKRYTINHSFNKLLLWYEGINMKAVIILLMNSIMNRIKIF